MNVKHGVEAKNYEGLGDANKLKPLEVELKRLEDLSLSIVQDFAYMRQREEEMRDTNESTNSRVLYFSIFSMCCLLGKYIVKHFRDFPTELILTLNAKVCSLIILIFQV